MPSTGHHRSASLTIRNLDARLEEKLRLRAALHGRSMEAEARDMLRQMLAGERAPEPNLAEAIRRRIEPLGGVELEPHPPVPIGTPPSLDG